MRGKTRRRKQRGGEIKDVIKEFIASLKENETRAFRLEFTMFGISYATSFSVERMEDMIFLHNSCIEINKRKYGTNSRISANIDTPSCFTPRLETIHSPRKRTTTDVLQTLKTKLHLLFDTDIDIMDVAEVNGVPISAYKLIRGEDTLYEKYGYENPSLQTLRNKIAETSWGATKKIYQTKNVKNMLDIVESFSEDTKDIDAQPIHTVMKRVPFEIEQEYNISYKLMRFLYNFTRIELKLNVDSDKWTYWNNALVFTKFEPIE